MGIGISQFVSLGNKADVSGNDLLEHWEQDPRTRVILLYLESLGNPQRFMAIARRVTRTKPIVVVKAGRTKAGARAASSHTGALAGMDVAVDALLGQAGVIRTDTMEQLFDVARLLAHQPVPAGSRVGILTNGGGPGIMAADACETSRLEVPPLGAATIENLRGFLPAEASLRNPVDMIASANASSYERALELLLRDPALDAVLVLFVHPMVTSARDVAAAIVRASRGNQKPVLACLLGTEDVPAGVAVLREAGIPAYDFPEAAVLALGQAACYGRWLQQPVEAPPQVMVDVERGRRALAAAADTGWLPELAVRDLLEAYGFRVVQSRFAATADAAVTAARELGFPVAIKLASPTITHKTDVGGVVLRLADEAAVRRAFAEIQARLRGRERLGEMTGVTVQPMIGGTGEAGIETFLGATEAGAFGRLVAFGLGGIYVEVLGDVAFGVPPLTARQAGQMIDRLRAAPLIAGYRGRPGADRVALIDAILRLDRLVRDLPEIVEVDINPLIALPEAGGTLVLDARVRVADRA
jgi:acyl-CoA synthetase (NDP forming)